MNNRPTIAEAFRIRLLAYRDGCAVRKFYIESARQILEDIYGGQGKTNVGEEII